MVLITGSLHATPLKSVWDAMENGDRTLARKLLNQALEDPQTKIDAAMTLILLNTIEGKEENLELMQTIYPEITDPSNYLYPVWFNDAVTDGYNKKDKNRFDFLNTIVEDNRTNASIKAAANYIIGMHYTFAHDFDKANKIWSEFNAIKDWQFTGPFNNTSGSGFDKDYEPVTNPSSEATFKSSTNSDIQWFTPAFTQSDPWITTINHIRTSQGIIYAQTFVVSPSDQEVILALGGTGSLKAWVNDQLVIEHEEEHKTELDIYKQKVKLNKGGNRLLIQLGFTDKSSYPNFIARFLDKDYNPIYNLTATTKNSPYQKASDGALKEGIPHFAEHYFKQKIEKEPGNIINHLLLSKVYFRREMFNEAIKVLETALKDHPKNILLNYELLMNYSDLNDRTELLKQIEKVRSLDPDISFFAYYDFEMSYSKQNYAECAEYLEKIEEQVGNDDKGYLNYAIRLTSAKKEYEEMYRLMETAYALYPEIPDFLSYRFYILKNTSTSKQAMKLLEKYLDNNFNSNIYNKLIEEYSNTGNKRKQEKVLLKLHEFFPEDISFVNKLIQYYYTIKDYSESLAYIEKGLSIAPFDDNLWYSKAFLHEALNDKHQAITDLNKAIHYNPNRFEAREKLRELEGKKPLASFFKNDEVYDIIENALKIESDSDNNYEYIFRDINYVIFPEGSSAEFTNIAIKMLNESGVEEWKEANISINSSRQNLVVEKAEVVKKNGEKIIAERSYTEMVFPSLEVGDAIYISYRIENYTGGKLSKEFWYSHVFNSFVPVQEASLRLFTPHDYELNFDLNNLEDEVKKNEIDEDFIAYELSMNNLNRCKDESYMPTLYEVGKVLHVSTVKSWRTISEWYSDLAMPQAKEDYNLEKVYNSIFEGKSYSTKKEKAKAIYDYICNNIKYSSVSFRQSNYTPQKPMITISTNLGDCKDLSTLFYTLAKKAGISTHLVLVNTRDNGEATMKLPSIDFNHCIIRIDLEDGPLYQELTNNKLPFGAMPNGVINAQALVIPNSKDDTVGQHLIKIPKTILTGDNVHRTATVQIKEDKMYVQTKVKTTGNMASQYRHYFTGLSNEETRESVKYVSTDYFDNDFTLQDYSFENLDNLKADLTFATELEVENEVKSIGGIKAVKPPLFEKIILLDNFPDEERAHDILYWKYESNDVYETEITVQLPEGANLVELPKELTLDEAFLNYQLSVEKIDNRTIKLKRTVKTNRVTLPADHYEEFRKAIKKIIKAEDIYIAYK